MQRPSIAETSAVIAHAMLRIRTDKAKGCGEAQELNRQLAILTFLLDDLQLNTKHLELVLMDQNATYKTRADAACDLARLLGTAMTSTPETMRKALSELNVIAHARDDADVRLAVGNLAERYGLDPEASTSEKTNKEVEGT